MMRAFALVFLLAVLQAYAVGAPKPVSPVTDECIAKGRIQSAGGLSARPIKVASECAAAAIAEAKFLEFTKHQVRNYRIFPMEHSAAKWSFMIQGLKNKLPDVGYHWMVTVDRATAKAELTPGA